MSRKKAEFTPEDRLIGIKHVADIFGQSEKTVRRRCGLSAGPDGKGEIDPLTPGYDSTFPAPAKRSGRNWFWRLSSIMAYVRSEAA